MSNVCVFCGSNELTHHTRVRHEPVQDTYCAHCGEWQSEPPLHTVVHYKVWICVDRHGPGEERQEVSVLHYDTYRDREEAVNTAKGLVWPRRHEVLRE